MSSTWDGKPTFYLGGWILSIYQEGGACPSTRRVEPALYLERACSLPRRVSLPSTWERKTTLYLGGGSCLFLRGGACHLPGR
jgi:hypothetical protein